MPKSFQQLSRSQVVTPPSLVDYTWEVVRSRRPVLDRVLDAGAGDGRFALSGHYARYVGIELDKSRIAGVHLPSSCELLHGCAFRHYSGEYDACVGNPPYVRYHDIEQHWRSKVFKRFKRTLGIDLDGRCNLFLYFICLGLERTHSEGLVAMIVPYEWVCRPSAKPIRDFIRDRSWDVDVQRLCYPPFKGVLTTACITVIDKTSTTGRWTYRDVDSGHSPSRARRTPLPERRQLLYEKSEQAWALRGLSPGSQKIFTLTEGERVHFGIERQDVFPCVTSLRNVHKDVSTLSQDVFKRNWIDAGRKCWLIKSHAAKVSARVLRYLEAVPPENRDTATCNARSPWYRFKLHPVPEILASSAFVGQTPKFLLNPIGAHAVGTVYGVHADPSTNLDELLSFLRSSNISRRIVPHAGRLRKLEVNQLNSLLNEFSKNHR